MTDLLQIERSWRAEGAEIGRKSFEAEGLAARSFGENLLGRRPVGDFRWTGAPKARKRAERSKYLAINPAKNPAQDDKFSSEDKRLFIIKKVKPGVTTSAQIDVCPDW